MVNIPCVCKWQVILSKCEESFSDSFHSDIEPACPESGDGNGVSVYLWRDMVRCGEVYVLPSNPMHLGFAG